MNLTPNVMLWAMLGIATLAVALYRKLVMQHQEEPSCTGAQDGGGRQMGKDPDSADRGLRLGDGGDLSLRAASTQHAALKKILFPVDFSAQCVRRSRDDSTPS
jgi:hypothetical protein